LRREAFLITGRQDPSFLMREQRFLTTCPLSNKLHQEVPPALRVVSHASQLRSVQGFPKTSSALYPVSSSKALFTMSMVPSGATRSSPSFMVPMMSFR